MDPTYAAIVAFQVACALCALGAGIEAGARLARKKDEPDLVALSLCILFLFALGALGWAA